MEITSYHTFLHVTRSRTLPLFGVFKKKNNYNIFSFQFTQQERKVPPNFISLKPCLSSYLLFRPFQTYPTHKMDKKENIAYWILRNRNKIAVKQFVAQEVDTFRKKKFFFFFSFIIFLYLLVESYRYFIILYNYVSYCVSFFSNRATGCDIFHNSFIKVKNLFLGRI